MAIMAIHRKAAPILASVLVMALSYNQAALAQAGRSLPGREICTEPNGSGVVDKVKLAEFLLRRSPISLPAILDHFPGGLPGGNLLLNVAAEENLCRGEDNQCTPADRESARSIRIVFTAMMAGSVEGFRAANWNVSRASWFRSPNAQDAIACNFSPRAPGTRAVAGGSTPTQPQPSTTTAVRIRGRVDELFIPRDDEAGLRTATPATINYTSNGTAGRDTFSVNGTVGLAFDLSPWFDSATAGAQGDILEIIPYVRGSRTLTRVRTGRPPDDISLASTGFTARAFVSTPVGGSYLGHHLELRPDYLVNFMDDSQILSLNLRYFPVVQGLLNSYIEIGAGESRVAWLRPMLDFRLSGGRYTARGDSAASDTYEDFLRIGGQIGMSFVSAIPNFPFDLQSTYTWMPGAVGRANVGYFSNKLTFSLDPRGFVGITLSYVNGTREDTTQREQQWSAGLSIRF